MAASSVQQRIVSAFKQVLKWVKKPWEITGPVASPEYKDPLPGALEYRTFSPATAPKRAVIPHDDPAQVLDIKYYTRDPNRDAAKMRTIKQVDPTKIPENPLVSPPIFKLGTKHHLNDCPGEGYQK